MKISVLRKRWLTNLLILFITALIFYFSWLPHPDIGLSTWFPEWLGKWTNENGNLRTAVPFVILGAALELQFVSESQVWKQRLINMLFALVSVVIAEAGQLMLPLRHFDIEDIIWGVVGGASGMGLGVLGRWVLYGIRRC